MLSHLDENDRPRVVDVSGKEATKRTAHARARVKLPAAVLDLLEDGEVKGKKGPVFQTAILAGVMAAKKTSELIPLCHPIGLEDCRITIEVNGTGEAVIDAVATVTHKTGVEMEAMVAVSVAALTIYDMCKGVSHDIVIAETRLVEKRGGKHEFRLQP